MADVPSDVSGSDTEHPSTLAPTLYALCGLPFAGKTTLASLLGRETGATVLRLDGINDEFDVGMHGAQISSDEWERTYAEAYHRISDCLARGESVIFDHGNFNRAE